MKALLSRKKNSIRTLRPYRQKREQSISQYTAGKLLAGAYTELDKITEQEKELADQQSEQEKNAQLAQAIMAAYQLKSAHDLYASQAKLLQDTMAQKERETARLPELKTAEETATSKSQAAKKAYTQELSAFSALQTKVTAAKENFAAIAAAEKACAAAQAQAAAAQSEKEKAQKT